MEHNWYRLAIQALLGAILAVAVPTAWAQPVDVEEETHFRCYIVSQQTPEPAKTVTLSDQFITGATLTVDEPLQFCAPTSKNGTEIEEPEEHLTMYAAPQELTPHRTVLARDQFGEQTLQVVSARVLLVPTQKLVGELDFPDRLNHYWCYEANGARVGEDVTLQDQFSGQEPEKVRVEEPRYFCNPVEKIHAGERFRIEERQVHLTCYEIHGPQKTVPTTFGMSNQLEEDTFTVTSYELLCVPSEKTEVSPAP
jgi:hypothetical protein